MKTGHPKKVEELRKPIHFLFEEQIAALCSDPDNFEEGEPRPTEKATRDLKRIFNDAAEILGTDIAQGDITPYFGELSVTWRSSNRMLRLTAFSDARNARLDYGTTPPGSLGDFDAVLDATGQDLADRINWLLAVPANT